MCCSIAAVQGYPQNCYWTQQLLLLDSAVVTISKAADSEDQHILPEFQIFIFQNLYLVIDTASPVLNIT